MNTLFSDGNIFEETPNDYAKRILNKDISIPAFQRDYVWSSKPKKILDLIESIYQGFNLGTVVFWESRVKGISRKEVNIVNSNGDYTTYNYIVDGQQRSLTLVSLLTDSNVVNLDLNKIFINLDESKGKLYFENSEDKNGMSITFAKFRTEILRKGNDVFSLFEHFSEVKDKDLITKFGSELRKLKSRITTEKIIVGYKLNIGASDIKLAIKQFEKINKTGIPLSEFDILDSLAYSDEKYDIKSKIKQTEIKSFEGILTSAKYSNDVQKIIINSFKLIKNYVDSGEKESISLSSDALPNFIDGDKKYLDFIFKYFKEAVAELQNLKLNSLKDIPYTHNIVIYIFIKFYVFQKNKNDDILQYSNKDFLFAIMFMTGIQKSYDKSASQKLVSHINSIINSIDSDKSIYLQDSTEFEISDSMIRNTSYESITAMEKAIFIYWTNTLQVRDYLKNSPVTLNGVFKNSKNIDHIFPKDKYFATKGKLVHCIANLALVFESTNKSKSDNLPSSWFGGIDYDKNQIMYESQMISDTAHTHLLGDEFEGFINKRASIISAILNEFMTELKTKL